MHTRTGTTQIGDCRTSRSCSSMISGPLADTRKVPHALSSLQVPDPLLLLSSGGISTADPTVMTIAKLPKATTALRMPKGGRGQHAAYAASAKMVRSEDPVQSACPLRICAWRT